MSNERFKRTQGAEAKYRLTATRKLIASAKILDIAEHEPDSGRRRPKERIDYWAAQRIARRPI